MAMKENARGKRKELKMEPDFKQELTEVTEKQERNPEPIVAFTGTAARTSRTELQHRAPAAPTGPVQGRG